MKRIITIVGVLGVAAMAMALSGFTKTFETKYNVKKTSVIGKAACMVCHTSAKGGKLNAYGTDVQAAMKAANSKKLTPEILAKVEGLDSNKDGVKNGDSIRQDKLP